MNMYGVTNKVHVYNKNSRTLEQQQQLYEKQKKLEEECCDNIKFCIFVFISGLLLVYLIIFIIIYF